MGVGSFGDEVFKIGMTRRLEPADRIKELSDASVPFEFDVHAMIACDDAPKLEAELHAEFEDLRINKVNYRKEFFRLPVDRLRAAVANRAVDVSFTMVAEAREYRESVALSKMSPEERDMACHPKLVQGDCWPTVAPAALWWASFACIHERRMVDQNSASWNPLISWLRQIDALRSAA